MVLERRRGMAIVKEIEPGMILGKFIDEKGLVYYKRDPETREYVLDENGEHVVVCTPYYYQVYLHSRRERTTGVYVPRTLAPYLRKLNVKLTGRTANHRSFGTVEYAVGCRLKRISKTEYDGTNIHGAAKAYYERMNNEDVHIKLTTEEASPYLEPIRSSTLTLVGVKEDENLSSYYS